MPVPHDGEHADQPVKAPQYDPVPVIVTRYIEEIHVINIEPHVTETVLLFGGPVAPDTHGCVCFCTPPAPQPVHEP